VETFGLTIIEAMAYGLPTIVPPIGGPKEIVKHEVNGFHHRSDNIKSIANTLHILFSDQSYYNKISQSAKEKAKEFSQEMFDLSIQRAFRFV